MREDLLTSRGSWRQNFKVTHLHLEAGGQADTKAQRVRFCSARKPRHPAKLKTSYYIPSYNSQVTETTQIHCAIRKERKLFQKHWLYWKKGSLGPSLKLQPGAKRMRLVYKYLQLFLCSHHWTRTHFIIPSKCTSLVQFNLTTSCFWQRLWQYFATISCWANLDCTTILKWFLFLNHIVCTWLSCRKVAYPLDQGKYDAS
jgi:hypothetical protein